MLAGELHGLVEELRAVAVRRVGVEPVEEQDRRPATAVERLDEVRLAVVDEAQVVDAGAVALDRCVGGRHGVSGGCCRAFAAAAPNVRTERAAGFVPD